MKLTYHPHLKGGQQVLTFNLEFFHIFQQACRDYSSSSLLVTPDAYDWKGSPIEGRGTVHCKWKKWENLAAWFNHARALATAAGMDFSQAHARSDG